MLGIGTIVTMLVLHAVNLALLGMRRPFAVAWCFVALCGGATAFAWSMHYASFVQAVGTGLGPTGGGSGAVFYRTTRYPQEDLSFFVAPYASAALLVLAMGLTLLLLQAMRWKSRAEQRLPGRCGAGRARRALASAPLTPEHPPAQRPRDGSVRHDDQQHRHDGHHQGYRAERERRLTGVRLGGGHGQ